MKKACIVALALSVAAIAWAARPFSGYDYEPSAATDYGINFLSSSGNEMVATSVSFYFPGANAIVETYLNGSQVDSLIVPAGVPMNFSGAAADSAHVDRTAATEGFIYWGQQ